MARKVRKCDHCEQPIVMLPIVWGEERPLRPFEPAEVPMGDVGKRNRYAFSRRRGGVMRLEHGLEVGSPHLPARSLVPHYCGRGLRLGDYVELMVRTIDQQFEGLGEPLMNMIKDGPPPDPRPWYQRQDPGARRGIGFRRGLGKRNPKEADASLQRLRDATENIGKVRNPPTVDEPVEEGENGQN